MEPQYNEMPGHWKMFWVIRDMLRYIHLIIRLGCFSYRSSQLCHVRRLQLSPHPASFQILNNQKNARRWENDDDVTTCNGCERQFSMTIRKVCFRGLKEDQTSITSSILFAIFFCFLLIFFPSFFSIIVGIAGKHITLSRFLCDLMFAFIPKGQGTFLFG